MAIISRYYDDSEGMMGNHHSMGHSPVGSFIKPKKDLESEQQQQQPEANNNSNRALDSSAETKPPEKKASAASRMVRGLGLKRGGGGGDRESQKSQKSTTSAASAGVASVSPSEEEENSNINSNSYPVQQTRPSSFRHMSPPPHLRLHRVPEDHDWVPPPPPPNHAGPAPPPHFYYDDYFSDDDLGDDYSRKNVPIWLSLLLVVAYIVWGAFIFQVKCQYQSATTNITLWHWYYCTYIVSHISGVGGLEAARQRLLLLHHSDHDRIRRPRAESADSRRYFAVIL